MRRTIEGIKINLFYHEENRRKPEEEKRKFSCFASRQKIKETRKNLFYHEENLKKNTIYRITGRTGF
jgi:hypothetical protein